MAKSSPVTTLVIYRPKKGKEKQLQALVLKHAPVLKGVGLITNELVKVWKATDKRSGDVAFVEIFQWKSEKASEVAHQTPEVMAVWEPMGAVLEELKFSKLELLGRSGKA